MKKLDEAMKKVDKRVDEIIKPYSKFFQKHFVVLSSVSLFLLFGMFFVYIYKSKSSFVASVVNHDLKVITKILQNIDEQCNILSIKGNRITLDFFTIKGFAGSVVGGMNLAHPENWGGAYLQVDPTIKGVFYELVRVADGFYVVPGDGVQLPNGLTIGKDVIIQQKTHIGTMIQPGGDLYYDGISFAVKMPFEIGDWDSVAPLKKETIEEINKVIKEFNDAMSFAQNQLDLLNA